MTLKCILMHIIIWVHSLQIFVFDHMLRAWYTVAGPGDAFYCIMFKRFSELKNDICIIDLKLNRSVDEYDTHSGGNKITNLGGIKTEYK